MKKKNLISVATFTSLLIIFQAVAGHAAEVRVAHFSPDAPPVDILIGGSDDDKSAVLTDVPFTAVSDYLNVPGGSYFIDVVPSAGGAAVIDVNGLAIADDATLTIAAVDMVANIAPLVLVDDNTIVPDKAKIRVVHASPDAPNVDVFIDGVGLLPELTNLPFKGATGYLEVDPGAYTFRIRATGTTDDAFVVPDLSLAGDRVYSAFAIGELTNGSFQVLPSVDAVPEPSSITLLAMSALAMIGVRRRISQA